jgi:hypothetical protein
MDRIGSSSGNDDAAEAQGSAERRESVGDLLTGNADKNGCSEPPGSLQPFFVTRHLRVDAAQTRGGQAIARRKSQADLIGVTCWMAS